MKRQLQFSLKGMLFMLGILMVSNTGFTQPQFYNNFQSSGTGNDWPLRTAGAAPWHRIQWLYGPGVFHDNGATGNPARSGYITSIYLNIGNQVGTMTYDNFTISMSQGYGTADTFHNDPLATPANSHPWVTTGLTQCFHQVSYQLTGHSAHSWYKIDLQTPFLYDSTKSLVVELKVDPYTSSSNGTNLMQPQIFMPPPNHTIGWNQRLRSYSSSNHSAGTGVFGLLNLGLDIAPVSVDSVEVITQGGAPATITTDGGTLQVEAIVYPVGTTNPNVTWSIVPVTATATVDPTGLITAAQSNGTVWVKAVSVADPTQSDSLLVTISNQIIPITSLTVATQGGASAAISTPGGSLQMTATVLPASASQDVTWSIVPVTGTATVSSTGLVTAQTDGTVWAKAVSVQDNSKMDSLQITISNQTSGNVRDLKFNEHALSMYPNPASNTVTIENATGYKMNRIVISNLLGQHIANIPAVNNKLTVDVSGYVPGLYNIHIHLEAGTVIKRLEVSK